MSQTRWTEQQGREFVRRWHRSGQSMAAFARERGLDPQRLRYWRERVERNGAGDGAGRARESQAGTALVPGVVVGVGVRAAVSVHLGRGVVVEIQSAREVEPGWLAELARALESEP